MQITYLKSFLDIQDELTLSQTWKLFSDILYLCLSYETAVVVKNIRILSVKEFNSPATTAI